MSSRRKRSSQSSCLTRSMVEALARVLIDVADQYPLRYLTERDFYPLVLAYLSGRVPKLKTEVLKDGAKVDFRVGGTNPAVLELAVRPRVIQDAYNTEMEIRGHKTGGRQHFASQNVTELVKLADYPQSKAKFRYLLLVDFQKSDNPKSLQVSYNEVAEQKCPARLAPITVVYATRGDVQTFTIKKSKKSSVDATQTLPIQSVLQLTGIPPTNDDLPLSSDPYDT